MSQFGIGSPAEIGLRLILSPMTTKVLTRTACFSVGTVFPVYSTFKAIESRDQNEQQKWLTYWAAYGSFRIVEIFTDKLIYWFPLYYQLKFAFLVWLQFPSVYGATQLYRHHLRPFLVKYQARLDPVVRAIHNEMGKFISSYQAEFGCAKEIVTRAALAVRDAFSIGQRQSGNAIEGPARAQENSESEIDE